MVGIVGINKILACLPCNVRGFWHQILDSKDAISLYNKYFSNQMCEFIYCSLFQKSRWWKVKYATSINWYCENHVSGEIITNIIVLRVPPQLTRIPCLCTYWHSHSDWFISVTDILWHYGKHQIILGTLYTTSLPLWLVTKFWHHQDGKVVLSAGTYCLTTDCKK